MKKRLLFPVLLMLGMVQANAQTMPTVIEYLDINNIKAAATSQGDLWFDPTTEIDYCQFPNGSGKNVAGLGGLWMAGYDASQTLHASITEYNPPSHDFYPGPLNVNGVSDSVTSKKWAKVWKVNYTDIESFLAQSDHTMANTPQSILEWPGAGNVYATGYNGDSLYSSMLPGQQYAPFVDVNGDGIYEPLQGDYPKIKGDQMLWWVYNDNSGMHNISLAQGFGAEVHVSAYAYHRGTLIDNVVYYQYDVINKSASTYTNFRMGQFADEDLGYAFDDLVGYDSLHRMGYAYNGDSVDQVYGTHVPMVGVSIVSMPQENSMPVGVGGFIVFGNDFSILGNPVNGVQYNFYMHGEDITGTAISDTLVSTYFTQCQRLPGDYRFAISSGDMTFTPGETKSMTVALVIANPDTDHACPDVNVSDITPVVDTAWGVYDNPLPQAVQHINTVQELINVYPNPAKDQLTIATQYAGTSYKLISITGVLLQAGTLQQGNNSLALGGIANGVYLLQLTDRNGNMQVKKVVKE